MIVEQIWTGNTYRNFNYLVVCSETGETLAIDPLDYKKCLARAKNQGWEITKIVNTHEHDDHIGGNQKIVDATGAKIFAHAGASHLIPGINIGLKAGHIIKVGNTVELEVLDTPGHTMNHVCLLSRTQIKALFCGDTLFNAGSGNCHNGGNPEELYNSFIKELSLISDDTLIYPGHDYLYNNLSFTLDREPNNQTAFALMEETTNQDMSHALVTTLGKEKEINTFFRLQNPEIIEQLQLNFPEIGDKPDTKLVFLKLRELRNSWHIIK